MFGLLARMFTRPRYSEVWCVGCRSRQRIREIGVVSHLNKNMRVHRLVGECTVCNGKTSTFVGATA